MTPGLNFNLNTQAGIRKYDKRKKEEEEKGRRLNFNEGKLKRERKSLELIGEKVFPFSSPFIGGNLRLARRKKRGGYFRTQNIINRNTVSCCFMHERPF